MDSLATPIKVVLLLGPTAVGKTALIKELNLFFSAVVYADVACLYKQLNIASAKPSLAEQSIIPHYGINLLNFNQSFDANRFCSYSHTILQMLSNNIDKVPLISGGSLFYIKQFLFGSSSAKGANAETRARVETEFNKLGSEAFYEKLTTIDPLAVSRIHKNDHYRLKRSLEIFYDSGRVQSSFHLNNQLDSRYEFNIIVLERDRNDLYSRINKRVDEMFTSGLEDEISSLKKMGATSSSVAMKGIGYSEWFDSKFSSINEVKEAIKQNSRRYAKRQITFLNTQINPHANVFNADDMGAIKQNIQKFINS